MSGIETFDNLNKKELASLEKIIAEICKDLNVGRDECIGILEKRYPHLFASYNYTKARALTSGEILKHPNFKKYTHEEAIVVCVYINTDDCSVDTYVYRGLPEALYYIFKRNEDVLKHFWKLSATKKVELLSSFKTAFNFYLKYENYDDDDNTEEIRNCFVITQTDEEDFTGTVEKDYLIEKSNVNDIIGKLNRLKKNEDEEDDEEDDEEEDEEEDEDEDEEDEEDEEED